jgi:hypothetical protein
MLFVYKMQWYVYAILIAIFLVIGWFATKGIKSQFILLANVFVYGPFLIWVATQIEETFVKVFLLLLGATTITYNARNWWQVHTFVKDSTITHPASWT